MIATALNHYVWCDNVDHPGDSHLATSLCVKPEIVTPR